MLNTTDRLHDDTQPEPAGSTTQATHQLFDGPGGNGSPDGGGCCGHHHCNKSIMLANVTSCCTAEGSMQRTQAASLSQGDPEDGGLCCLLEIRHGTFSL
jgi:hypothetical protein